MTTSPGVSAPSGGPPKEYRITAHARAGGLAAVCDVHGEMVARPNPLTLRP